MTSRFGALLALGLLGGLGAGLVLAALVLGLAALLGPVAALALVGTACLASAALGLALLRRRPPSPLAELGVLLGVLVLRRWLRR